MCGDKINEFIHVHVYVKFLWLVCNVIVDTHSVKFGTNISTVSVIIKKMFMIKPQFVEAGACNFIENN